MLKCSKLVNSNLNHLAVISSYAMRPLLELLIGRLSNLYIYNSSTENFLVRHASAGGSAGVILNRCFSIRILVSFVI